MGSWLSSLGGGAATGAATGGAAGAAGAAGAGAGAQAAAAAAGGAGNALGAKAATDVLGGHPEQPKEYRKSFGEYAEDAAKMGKEIKSYMPGGGGSAPIANYDMSQMGGQSGAPEQSQNYQSLMEYLSRNQ